MKHSGSKNYYGLWKVHIRSPAIFLRSTSGDMLLPSLVGGLQHQFCFPINIGNFIIPIDFHIFQRGSNHQPDQYVFFNWFGSRSNWYAWFTKNLTRKKYGLNSPATNDWFECINIHYRCIALHHSHCMRLYMTLGITRHKKHQFCS